MEEVEGGCTAREENQGRRRGLDGGQGREGVREGGGSGREEWRRGPGRVED